MEYKLPDWYLAERAELEAFFTEENCLGEEELDGEPVSPSGKYRLKVEAFGAAQSPWSLSQGTITRASDGSVVAVLKRNYCLFWHAWVRQDEREFLLCGEDYQGFTVVDLNFGLVHTYIPEEAKDGGGYCWVRCLPSPDGRLLAVDGCYWACPYEVRIYDFSEPTGLPLLLLRNLWDEKPDVACELVRWMDEGTLEVKFTGTLEAVHVGTADLPIVVDPRNSP